MFGQKGVRPARGAEEKQKIEKGTANHTESLGFYPKGNQMQLRAFKRGCGRIRFAFAKIPLAAPGSEGSEGDWQILDQK